MTKQLSGNLQTALARDAIVSYLLLNINGTRYTDAPFDITSSIEGSSNTYEAQGNFLGIGEVDENSDLAISTIAIQLSALVPVVVANFATPSIINQDVSIYRILYDQSTEEPVGDSTGDNGLLIFKGRVSAYDITDAEETASVTITVESQFADFEKINCRRTNLTSFQRLYPNDWGMEFSHETLNDLGWGRKV